MPDGDDPDPSVSAGDAALSGLLLAGGVDEEPNRTKPAVDSEVEVGEGSASAPPGSQRRARPGVRRFTIAALYSVALVGIGVVLGWQAFARITPQPPETEIVEVPIVSDQSAEATMPDVRGLTEKNARTALVDAGIPADLLTVTTNPAAGSPGIVIDQDPAYGTSNPESVALVISTPAAVPDLAGTTESEATAELLALGARVEVQREYSPAADPGNVIKTKPKAGKPVGEAVTLTVAEPPASVYLTQLDTVDDSDSCGSQDQAVLGGSQYDNALSCSADSEGRQYTWLLADKADQFVALIGVPDEGDQQARATVRVLVDGKERASGTASYTKPVPVNIPVTGGTQLQIRLTDPDDGEDSGYFGSSRVDVIVADGRLIGSSAGINALAGWSQ